MRCLNMRNIARCEISLDLSGERQNWSRKWRKNYIRFTWLDMVWDGVVTKITCKLSLASPLQVGQ